MTSLTLAPHLEAAVERLSKDLGLAPEAVVQQAVAAWLRTNGYSTAPRSVPEEAVPEKPAASTALTPALTPTAAPEPDPAPAPRSVRAESRTSAVPELPAPPPSSTPLGQTGTALARMAEIDADLAALAKPWPAWSEDATEEEAPDDDAEQDEEPNTGQVPVQPEPEADEPAPESTIVLKSVPVVLYLQRGDEEPVRITQERFIIGRGPHCDLIIDSPRVSREHVALTRAGIMYFIEDLNSSNGTWFNEERVTKKELESGDVISLGNEPVTFFLRGE